MVEKMNEEGHKYSDHDMATVGDLVRFGKQQWHDWLRDGIGRWFSVEIGAEAIRPGDPSRVTRRRAFAPIPVRDNSEDPVRDLAANLRRVLEDGVAKPARGVGLLLGDWQILLDGAEATAFIILLAANLGTPNLAQCLRNLLERPLQSTVEGRRSWTSAMVSALSDRASPREARDVARAMKAKGLFTPEHAARLLPKLAENDLGQLASLLAELCPALISRGVGDPAAKALALNMQYTKDWKLAPARPPRNAPEDYPNALALIEAARVIRRPVPTAPQAQIKEKLVEQNNAMAQLAQKKITQRLRVRRGQLQTSVTLQ